MSPAAVVLAARGLWGAALLAVPGRVLALTGSDRSTTATRILRVLGARHVVQAVVQPRGPAPVSAYLGSVVDTLHALSGVGLAALDRRWRRAALLDSAIASGFAMATALTAAARS